MGVNTTVVFADLTGSTGVFESLGNAKATEAVTRLTQWIGKVCEAHGGRVVKTLGDGVLIVFPEAIEAVEAVVELQNNLPKRVQSWPDSHRMKLKVGVASGDIVEVDGDCYGDAVNVASRLSDMCDADEIWTTDAVIDQVSHMATRYRSLGLLNIRGKAEPMAVYSIDWEEETSEFLTVQASLNMLKPPVDTSATTIELSWLVNKASYPSERMPIQLGRVIETDFVVNDPRVSRTHARIEWRHGSFVLVDVSSYGTWIRFTGDAGSTELVLRREECVLHGSGEIGLGAPFSDFSAPIVAFNLVQGSRKPALPAAKPDGKSVPAR